jgi:hypothetical protein
MSRTAGQVGIQFWISVARDFIVVVVGVYIALLVHQNAQDWREERDAAEQWDRYLEALHSDFNGIVNELEFAEAHYRQSVTHADLLLRARAIQAGEAEGELPSEEEISQAVRALGHVYMQQHVPATFAIMRHRGDLDLFRDPDLIRRLYEYERRVGDLREIWRDLENDGRSDWAAIEDILTVDRHMGRAGAVDIVDGVDLDRFYTAPDLPDHLANIMALRVRQHNLVLIQLDTARSIEDQIALWLDIDE